MSAIVKTLNFQKRKKQKINFFLKVVNFLIGINIFLLFLVWPLFFRGNTWQGIIFEKQIYLYFWLLFSLFLWFLKIILEKKIVLKITQLDYLLFLSIILISISSFFSVDQWRSFWGEFKDPAGSWVSILSYIIIFYFLFYNFNLQRLKLVLSAILVSGFILVVGELNIFLHLNFFSEKIRQYFLNNPFYSPANLGLFLASLNLILLTVILKIAANNILAQLWKKFILAFLLVYLLLDLLVITLLYQYIVGGALLLGNFIFFLFLLAKFVKIRTRWLWLPGVVFLFFLLLNLLIENKTFVKIDFPATINLNHQTSFQIAKESLKHNFFLGSGPATYKYAFSLRKPKEFNLTKFYSKHFSRGAGFLEESLTTIGFLGTMVWLWLLFFSLGWQFYYLYQSKNKDRIYSLGIFSAWLVLLVNLFWQKIDGINLFEVTLIGSLAWATIFYEFGQEKEKGVLFNFSPKIRVIFIFLFLFSSGGLIYLSAQLNKIYQADVKAQEALQLEKKDLEKSIDYMSQAIRLNQRETNYYLHLGQYYITLANQEAQKERAEQDINKIKDNLNKAIAIVVQAKNIAEKDVAVIEYLAMIYENAGFYVTDSLDLAEKNYQKALQLEPHNPQYYLKLGQIKLVQAKRKKKEQERKELALKAQKLLEKSIEEKNNLAESYYYLALTNEMLGKINEAIKTEQEALKIDPYNNRYLLALGRMYQKRNKENDNKIAEQIYEKIIQLDEKNITGHFYLGVLLEKRGEKEKAKIQYQKTIQLLEESNGRVDIIIKIKKMISNLDKGIKNTLENINL